MDNEIETTDKSASSANAIFNSNVALMDQADAILANIIPFRGPGLDAGTAFEIGYMRALGKPIFVYLDLDNFNSPHLATDTYFDKVNRTLGLPKKQLTDHNNLTIEHFGLVDNLMICCASQNHHPVTSFDDILDHAIDYFLKAHL